MKFPDAYVHWTHGFEVRMSDSNVLYTGGDLSPAAILQDWSVRVKYKVYELSVGNSILYGSDFWVMIDKYSFMLLTSERAGEVLDMSMDLNSVVHRILLMSNVKEAKTEWIS